MSMSFVVSQSFSFEEGVRRLVARPVKERRERQGVILSEIMGVTKETLVAGDGKTFPKPGVSIDSRFKEEPAAIRRFMKLYSSKQLLSHSSSHS